MATGGPPKQPPLRGHLNFRSPDVFKDALSDLKLSDRTTSTSNLDQKQSESRLRTMSGKGSTTSLKTVGTGNLSSMTNVASGSLKDTGTKPKGQTHPTKFVVEAVNPEEQTTKCQKNLLKAITNLTHAINEAKADKAKAKDEKEETRSRIKNSKAGRQTVSTASVDTPPQVDNSIPTGSGTEHSGYWPETGKRRGGGGKGGGTPDQGDDPPFQPSTNDNRDTTTVIIQKLIDALRNVHTKEDELDSETNPNHSVLQTCICGRRVLLENNKYYRYQPFPTEPSVQVTYPSGEQLVKPTNKSSRQDYTNTETLCPVCRDDSHELSTCPEFRKLSTYKRYAVARFSKSCFHCLNRGHPMSSCKVNKGIPCGINGCKRYENPLIHNPTTKDNKTVKAAEVVTNFATWSTNPVGSMTVRPKKAVFILSPRLIAQNPLSSSLRENPSQ